MKVPRLTRIASGIAVSIVLTAIPLQTATADSIDGADRVESVAVAAGGVVADFANATPVSEIETGVNISLPSDDDATLRLDSPAAAELSISIPFSNGAGVESTTGLVSFDDAPNASSVISPGADGSVRVASVIENGAAPSRFDYKFASSGKIQLVPDSTTGAVVVSNNSKPIAVVTAPWAVDATGKSVPTHFEINGSTLTQVVDHQNSAYSYPIIADPATYYFWWGQAIKFTRSETSSVAAAADSGNPAVAAAFCGFITNAPGAVVCGVVSALFINTVGNTFKSARAQKKCVQVNMPYVGIIIGGPLTWQLYIEPC